MTSAFTEASYENSLIELFINMGYDHVYGPDIERDYRNPLYMDVLEDSIQRINKGAPEEALTNALDKLKNFENASLVQKNQLFMDYLQNGIEARYHEKDGERTTRIYLADYRRPENNSFIIANQWTFIEHSEKRPDIVLFLNASRLSSLS